VIEHFEMNEFTEKIKIRPMPFYEDTRGWLLKMLMRQDIEGDKTFGEIYVTTAFPGIVKAQHYHRCTREWFCIVRGTGKLILEDIITHCRKDIILGEDNKVLVEVPPKVAHAVKNIGTDLMYLLAYADTPYNPEDPDTIPYRIKV
jgi:dTDP-4-dehydrorhamnose 3,5-epimerase